MTDYNGWTNRNTWLIGLHFGDLLRDYAEDGYIITPDAVQSIFVDYFEMFTKDVDPVIMDFMDISEINWKEIADHWGE